MRKRNSLFSAEELEAIQRADEEIEAEKYSYIGDPINRIAEDLIVEAIHYERKDNQTYRRYRVKKQYNQRNAEAIREQRRAYRETHAEEIKAYQKAWIQKNRVRIRAYDRIRYLRRREKVKAYKAAYYLKHVEEIREKNRRYYAEHKEEFRIRSARYRARNAEQIRAKKAEYYQRNREQILAAQKAKLAVKQASTFSAPALLSTVQNIRGNQIDEDEKAVSGLLEED